MTDTFKPRPPLDLKFAEPRAVTPYRHGVRAWVQGSIVYIGDEWLYPAEARALRDWLNEVLP